MDTIDPEVVAAIRIEERKAIATALRKQAHAVGCDRSRPWAAESALALYNAADDVEAGRHAEEVRQ